MAVQTMKSKMALLGAIIISFVITACGGGGGGSGVTTTSAGSISGKTTPGAIVGIRCLTNVVQPGQIPQSCNVPAFTTTADSSGNYSLTGITQKGFYIVWASHGGYFSYGGNGCDFNYGGAQSFFDCSNTNAGPLATYTPYITPTNGFSGVLLDDFTAQAFYYTNTDIGIRNISSSNGLATGNFTTGGRSIISGALYEWNDSSGNRSTLSYDSAHGVIRFILVPFNAPSDDGLICSVGSSVSVGGLWAYPCSSFGVTFNSAAGTITFAATPIYRAVSVYGGAYPYTSVVATGSLTFPPF